MDRSDTRHWLRGRPGVAGVALTLGVIAALELIRAARGEPVSNPTPWPMLAAVFAAFIGGVPAGLASAACAWVYIAFVASSYHVLGPDGDSQLSRTLSWAVALPAVAFMAGSLRDRLRYALAAEALHASRAWQAEQRLAVEAELRESKTERVRAADVHAQVLDAMPAHVALVDKSGVFLSMNLGWREFVARRQGVPRPGELPGTIEDFERLAAEHCKPIAREAIAGIREVLAGTRDRFLLDYQTEDQGRQVWLQLSASPIDVAGRGGALLMQLDVTARHSAHEAIAASERHFHALADSAPVLIWISGPDGRPTYYNRAWLEARGTTLEAELAAPHSESVHPDDRALCESAAREAIEHRRQVSLEFRMLRKDGSYALMLKQIVPRISDSGELEGLTGACTDITEIRRAADQVKSNEGALRGLLRAIPDPIFRMRRDGTYLGYSAHPDVDLTLPPEAFLGKRVTDVLPPEFAARVLQALESTAATGRSTVLDYRRAVEGGTQHWEIRIVPCEKDELLMIARDVTSERRTEAALRVSEERLRVQFERMPLACILTDVTRADLPIVQWNPAAESIFGWSKDEVIGRNALDVVVPPDIRPSVDAIIDRLRAGDMAAHSTNENITKSGRRIICEWFNTPLHDSNGRIVALFSTAQDITAKRRYEEELRQSQKMDAIGHLAGGVAHDFNNLLTAIFGYTNLARRTLQPTHPANTSLDRVEEAARQASGVTKALLTFSRDDAAEKKPCQLARAVRDAVRLLRRTLPSNIDLRTAYDLDAPIWIEGDSTQLQQVVLNLAINARDAMPSGGVLSVSVTTEPVASDRAADGVPELRPVDRGVREWAVLTVSDTGVGISDELLPRIFEPFFTTKPLGQGTGLGLAIVHGIVRDHNGRVDVTSTPGRGSTFKVRLPMVEAPALPGEHSSVTPTTKARGELVLLADDYTYVREIMASMLISLGYRVVQASDGAALLAAFETHRDEAQLIVLDDDMPVYSGVDCIQQIRAGGSQVPAVIVSGNAQSIPSITRLGVLRKPFQMGELAAAISDVVSSSGVKGEPAQ